MCPEPLSLVSVMRPKAWLAVLDRKKAICFNEVNAVAKMASKNTFDFSIAFFFISETYITLIFTHHQHHGLFPSTASMNMAM